MQQNCHHFLISAVWHSWQSLPLWVRIWVGRPAHWLFYPSEPPSHHADPDGKQNPSRNSESGLLGFRTMACRWLSGRDD